MASFTPLCSPVDANIPGMLRCPPTRAAWPRSSVATWSWRVASPARSTGHPTSSAWPPVELSVVCFRYGPRRWTGDAPRLDALNRALVERIQADGRVFLTGTVLRGRFALRACNSPLRDDGGGRRRARRRRAGDGRPPRRRRLIRSPAGRRQEVTTGGADGRPRGRLGPAAVRGCLANRYVILLGLVALGTVGWQTDSYHRLMVKRRSR